MPHQTIAALGSFLRPHVGLSKSRLETLCLLIVGIVSARTVNLGHIACERPSTARTASTCRRLQRFFQHVRLGEDWALPLVAGLVGPARRWTLVLDWTNWAIGSREVNYLVLAVVTRRFRVPLAWTVLPGAGNSSTAARIALIGRYRAHFPASIMGVSGTLCIRRRSGSNLTALNHPAARSDPRTLWRTGLPLPAIL